MAPSRVCLYSYTQRTGWVGRGHGCPSRSLSSHPQCPLCFSLLLLNLCQAFISLSLATYQHLPASPCVFVLSACSLYLYASNFLFLGILTSASLSFQDFL